MRYSIYTAAVAAFVAGSPAMAAPANVPALQSTVTYKNGADGPSTYRNFARATSKVVYDSALGTYTLRDTGSTAITSNFAPANIDSQDSDFVYYDKSSGSNVETFRLLKQSALNTKIVLQYVTYGQWRRSSTTSGVTTTNDTYVVFGTKTPRDAVPTSGSASYTSYMDGTFVNADDVYAVTGTGSINANFLTGGLSYSMTANGAAEGSGPAIAFGAMTGAGTISYRSAGFNGTGTTNGSGYKLDVNGNFYGPAAQEVGGIFRLTGNGGNGTGAIVGRQP